MCDGDPESSQGCRVAAVCFPPHNPLFPGMIYRKRTTALLCTRCQICLPKRHNMLNDISNCIMYVFLHIHTRGVGRAVGLPRAPAAGVTLTASAVTAPARGRVCAQQGPVMIAKSVSAIACAHAVAHKHASPPPAGGPLL